MWQRFTDRARKIVFYAQEEAQRFGEDRVSTEHLLLGIVRLPDSTASRVLERLGVSLRQVRAEIEKQLPVGNASPAENMTLTPRAKRTIDLAYKEATRLNNDYIGSEHLLLSLLADGDGLAAKVLAKLGLELDRTRREVVEQQGKEWVDAVAAKPTPAPFITTGYDVRVSNALAKLLTEDPALLEDPAGFAAALGIRLPGATRERRVLIHVLELGLPQEIQTVEGDLSRPQMFQWTERLEQELGLTNNAARFAVRAWVIALGRSYD